MRPTGAPQTYWMLQFKFSDHFLLLIISGRFEVRTILDTFRCALNTSLGFVFMCRFVTHRTCFLTPLVNDSSIFRLVTFPRVSLVTRRAFVQLVTFCRKSSIDGLIGEHFLGCLSLLLEVVEEVCPSRNFLLTPLPGNLLRKVFSDKSNIFLIVFEQRETP